MVSGSCPPDPGPATPRSRGAPPRSDHQILADHLAGDPKAFGELACRHADRLWRTARVIVGDPDDAADALQNALLRAFRLAGSFRGDSQVVTWLHTIVTRTALNQINDRRRHHTENLDDRPLSCAVDRNNADDWVGHEVISAVVRALPPEQRDCFVRIDLLGFSYAEVAAELQLSEGTVKSRRARAKARLIAALCQAGLIGATPQGYRSIQDS